jgi:hypothetical protein
MNIREKIEIRMDSFEADLKAGTHLSNPEDVTDKIFSISKFWSILDDEHRDFINAARYAIEEQIQWS